MDTIRTNLVFDTFTQDEFESLPPDVRMGLCKARGQMDMQMRRLMDDMREQQHILWQVWLRVLLDAKETLHQQTKE